MAKKFARIGLHTTHTFYHLFHPSEHGRIRVAEPATDGTPGMGVGALVEREEWFGPFDSKGDGRITQFSSKGMTVVPEEVGMLHAFPESAVRQPAPRGCVQTVNVARCATQTSVAGVSGCAHILQCGVSQPSRD